MVKIISALTLLLWTGCYLNCSLGQFGGCAESVFSLTETDPCPDSSGEEVPDTCEDFGSIFLTQEGDLTPEIPFKDLSDYRNLLVHLIVLKAREDDSVSVISDFSSPEFSRSEQDCIRVSRPIRGPSV